MKEKVDEGAEQNKEKLRSKLESQLDKRQYIDDKMNFLMQKKVN